jgi:sec-independent protein translocase protein TatA
MNIFGIGLPEMALIFILALLVFGPKKLPEIGKTLGKTIRGFQDASKEFEQEFKRAAESIEDVVKEAPMQATLEPPAQLAAAPEIPEAILAETPAAVAVEPEAAPAPESSQV